MQVKEIIVRAVNFRAARAELQSRLVAHGCSPDEASRYKMTRLDKLDGGLRKYRFRRRDGSPPS